jgi:hypothetical protein
MFSPPRSCQSAARDQQLVPSGVERDAHDLERAYVRARGSAMLRRRRNPERHPTIFRQFLKPIVIDLA